MSPKRPEFRDPTSSEEALIRRLLMEEFPGRDELRAQMERLSVREIDENGSLELVSGSSAPDAAVIERVPTEGRMPDRDGMIVNVLLHVVNGRLNELEIYRDDSGPVEQALIPEKLIVEHP